VGRCWIVSNRRNVVRRQLLTLNWTMDCVMNEPEKGLFAAMPREKKETFWGIYYRDIRNRKKRGQWRWPKRDFSELPALGSIALSRILPVYSLQTGQWMRTDPEGVSG